jgi:predicted NBD/HSP70 family sugar kinase
METLHTSYDDERSRKAVRKALIRFFVWKHGPVSRGRLSEGLRLNLPTVSTCAAELLATNDLIEEGYANSTGGRKPQLLDINAERGTVIGLTFSSRGISSACANLKGRVSNLRIYPFSPSGGREVALKTLRQAVADQFSHLSSVSGAAPAVQIGVAMSGILDPVQGVSRLFPRFEEWRDVPLASIIESEFRVPVVMDNHVAAIALAESIFGKYRGFRNALYAQLGPGLGVGIIIDGRIYRGSRTQVGEFGHTQIIENGPICYCGNYGCLESVASDYALVQQVESALREGVQTRIPEFTPEPGKITPGSIFRAAAAGDRFALNLIERVGRLLGTGIANLVNLFGPELVILGGTMSEAGDLMLGPITRTLENHVLDRSEKRIELRTSSFGSEEAMKGAVTLALHEHFSRGLSERDLVIESI